MAERAVKRGRKAVVWVICGAGKGVGKTHLAQALCRVLPRARYAKLGHCRRRKNGPVGYFNDRARFDAHVMSERTSGGHLVLESNALAREGIGDVVVFVDAARGHASMRPDAAVLKRNAHVVVGPRASVDTWMRILRGRLHEAGLRARVCDALLAQARYRPEAHLEVRSKVWFVRNGERVFGNGLARLFEAIRARRSLVEAARDCGVSYRHAWNLIRTAERRFGGSLTVPQVGGTGGGGSRLSGEGEKLLALYKDVVEEVMVQATSVFRMRMGEKVR